MDGWANIHAKKDRIHKDSNTEHKELKTINTKKNKKGHQIYIINVFMGRFMGPSQMCLSVSNCGEQSMVAGLESRVCAKLQLKVAPRQSFTGEIGQRRG